MPLASIIVVPISVASPCTWSIEAKKLKWSSHWITPNVKQPHSSGLGMSTTWAWISSTVMCPCVTGTNSMSPGSVSAYRRKVPSPAGANQLRKVSCRRR